MALDATKQSLENAETYLSVCSPYDRLVVSILFKLESWLKFVEERLYYFWSCKERFFSFRFYDLIDTFLAPDLNVIHISQNCDCV